jgi:hypothetical protein
VNINSPVSNIWYLVFSVKCVLGEAHLLPGRKFTEPKHFKAYQLVYKRHADENDGPNFQVPKQDLFFCSAGDWTQDFVQARQGLYHWAIPQAQDTYLPQDFLFPLSLLTELIW